MRWIGLVALLTLGCRNLDEDLTLVDADGDGVMASDDCNDADASVFPGASEVCNGVDDDCSGVVDDVPDGVGTPYYPDRDGDGVGDGDPIYACALLDGVAALAGDCDDTDPSIYPGAPEPDCTDPVDHDCDGQPAAVDGDGDGVPACLDCDDADPLAFPGGIERCDGRDGDCDGVADGPTAVDAPTWYLDADGDGFGDPDSPTRACAAPARHVADDEDCDDTTRDVHPGADEVCDGADQDCDGSADEAAIDAPAWHLDADRDGFGGPDTLVACEAPRGYLADDRDCDDLDASAHPGAQEVCDGDDEDCDGAIDEEGAVGEVVFFADPDGDGYGDPAYGTLAACARPSGYADVAGDCGEEDATRYPGAPEACNDTDDDCDTRIDEDAVDATRVWVDADGDRFGNPAYTRLACRLPQGWADNDRDCDDTRAAVNPDGVERCNDLDDDCNGQIDDDPVDPRTWWIDADGDRWGTDDDTVTSCQRPRGYAGHDGDCAPEDPTVNPGADETCDDVDRDCDGDPHAGAVDAPTWYADLDRDGFGGEELVRRACERPPAFQGDHDDCDDLDAGINPDARDICGDGIDQDCDGRDRTGSNGETPECAATSCAEILESAPDAPDGAYYVDATGDRLVRTWCDLSGGGWMLGFTKNSVHEGLYHDFGAGYVDVDALTTHPADASTARGPIAGWLDLNEASYDELRLAVYSNGRETWRSEAIDRSELRIDFGQDGYFLYDSADGYYWCGGTHAYTDLGQGQVNRPRGAPADCKGHGSLGDGWDFSHSPGTNQGLTLCGANHSRWMHREYGGANVAYPTGGAAQAIWVR